MSLLTALGTSAIFEQQCPFLVSDYVNKHIGNHSITIQRHSSANASLWHRSLDDAISLSKITYGNSVRVRSPELKGIYHLQIVLNGHCRWHFRDRNIVLSEGGMMILNPGEEVDLTYSEDCAKIILKIPSSIIADCVINHGVMLPKGGVKFAHVPQHISHLKTLSGLVELLCIEAESEERNDSMFSPYQALLANKLLTIFRNNSDIGIAQNFELKMFKQIDNYIDANIKTDVSIEELAEVSNVSKRTLYNLFAKHRSVSPKYYVKQKKLAAVRQLLQAKPYGIANVTEIAMDYGFVHLGRFSSDYKKAFGELPSRTLKSHAVA